jgi:hypothetical protein
MARWKRVFVSHDLGSPRSSPIDVARRSGGSAEFSDRSRAVLQGGGAFEEPHDFVAELWWLDRLDTVEQLANFKAGRRHNYSGGLARRSPVHLAIPRSGHWYVTVDMSGLRGRVRSSARVLPGPLPLLQDASLASVPSLLRDQANRAGTRDGTGDTYDILISHASEDKESVVRPLVAALKEAGLSVWFDELELKIGDSLRRKIDRGLATSRFGIVVLSRAFLGKGWTNYELDGLVTKSVSGDQVLLPIWHEVTKQEVIDYSPSLADRYGVIPWRSASARHSVKTRSATNRNASS